MNTLQMKLREIEDTVRRAQQTLNRLQFGSTENNLAIETSLILQRRVLRQRIEGMNRLCQTLHYAMQEYAESENRAKEDAEPDPFYGVVAGVAEHIAATVNPPMMVNRGVEQKTIDSYIRPLISGKKGTT